jgi:hypothetical protein
MEPGESGILRGALRNETGPQYKRKEKMGKMEGKSIKV